MFTSSLRLQWLSDVRGDLFAGTVVALALIPEAIASSSVAGGDPEIGRVVHVERRGGSQGTAYTCSASGALDKVVMKFEREGATVEVSGVDRASATVVERVARHDKPGAVGQPMH